MDLVLILAAVLIGSTVSPIVLARIQGRQHGLERKEDMRRQDKVANLLVSANDSTSEKLDSIHVLVNSNMTASMQAELEATVRELAMMKEVIALNKAAGRNPSNEALDAIQFTQSKVDELAQNLNDRRRQARIEELQPHPYEGQNEEDADASSS